MELKTGDIILIQNNRWIARIIRKATKSKWSHSETVLVDDGETMLIGANEKGVRIKDFNKYLSDKDLVCVLRSRTRLNYHNINIIAKFTAGTEYDFKSLIFYQVWMQLFHKWKGRKGKAATDKFYCSELSGYLIGLYNWWRNSPQDLYTHKQLEILYEGSKDSIILK